MFKAYKVNTNWFQMHFVCILHLLHFSIFLHHRRNYLLFHNTGTFFQLRSVLFFLLLWDWKYFWNNMCKASFETDLLWHTFQIEERRMCNCNCLSNNDFQLQIQFLRYTLSLKYSILFSGVASCLRLGGK